MSNNEESGSKDDEDGGWGRPKPWDPSPGTPDNQEEDDGADLIKWLTSGKGNIAETDCIYHLTRYNTQTLLRMYLPTINRVLCSRRVSQMTKTYSDIEAVTRLLEEKEKDLELTARIGKELLAQNARLEGQVHELEGELTKTRETITQLQHEILRKTELIQVMTNDATPVSEDECPVWSGSLGVGDGSRVVDGFKLLERKITSLESENEDLRKEAERLAVKTEESEAQETRLVADLMSRLEEERGASNGRDLELDRLRQAVSEMQDSLDSLHARLEIQTSARETAEKERDEYLSKWAIGRETEAELVSELADLKEKYTELVNYMEEYKDSMKKSTKKKGPTVRTGPLGFPSLGAASGDCLASELETSLLSELSLDSGISGTSSLGGLGMMGSIGGGGVYRRAMDTVRCSATIAPSAITGGALSNLTSPPLPSPTPPLPSELEAAVRAKLTPHAVESRRRALSSLPDAPYECLTPDSLLSGSLSLGASSCWKLPERLQIVKPVEGSMTLHHWSKLAEPSLGGFLDERPGVKTRGGADLEALGFTNYSLSDMEEDDETTHPGKSFQQSNHIFTYTTSRVRHHASATSVTNSYRGSQVSSVVSSAVPSLCSTPRGLSRRSSVTSLSGLAAQPPPVITTNGVTATPPPSPTRSLSPDPSETDEDYSYSTLGLPGFLMTSGAELLKRTLGSALKSPTTPKPKSALVRPDNKAALTGIRLVETLERIGLEEILATGPSSTLHQAGLRRRIAESTASGGVLGLPATSPTPAPTNASPPPPPKPGERRRRPDLGSVPAQPPTPTHRPQATHSALGILSSLLFGRKGGLL